MVVTTAARNGTVVKVTVEVSCRIDEQGGLILSSTLAEGSTSLPVPIKGVVQTILISIVKAFGGGG